MEKWEYLEMEYAVLRNECIKIFSEIKISELSGFSKGEIRHDNFGQLIQVFPKYRYLEIDSFNVSFRNYLGSLGWEEYSALGGIHYLKRKIK